MGRVTAASSNAEIRRLFEEKEALLTGHFLLTSGLHSSRYLQCARVLMDPVLATRLGADLAMLLFPVLGRRDPAAVVAPAIGGILVAQEVARAFGCRSLFTEREQGKMVLRRGFTLAPGEPVVVVEDVITTGGSARETFELAMRSGAELLGVAALVDRSTAPLAFPLRALLRVEAVSWDAAECPMCAAGVAIDSPGSRHLTR